MKAAKEKWWENISLNDSGLLIINYESWTEVEQEFSGTKKYQQEIFYPVNYLSEKGEIKTS